MVSGQKEYWVCEEGGFVNQKEFSNDSVNSKVFSSVQSSIASQVVLHQLTPGVAFAAWDREGCMWGYCGVGIQVEEVSHV